MGSTASKADAEFSACVPMSSTSGTVKVSASTSTANVQLAPGQWKVALRGADATAHVYLAFGATNAVTAAEPSDTATTANGASGSAVASFRGDEVERIVVTSAAPFVAYILSSGAATNKLVFTKLL